MSVRVLQGDCREVLRTLPDASVQCCVTSPPYYGLRDYGVAGQIGLEQSPDAYVAEMVAVFREVRRVLRDDGTCWLNLGDSYNNRTKVRTSSHQPALNDFVDDNWAERASRGGCRMSLSDDDLKEKDLIGIPWMVAFALRADGWYLRSDLIWAKRNCMPESVRDRPTRAHEYLFLLTKQARYFYDAVAIEEEGDIPAGTRAAKGSAERAQQANGRPPEYAVYTGKRNKRSVWWVATQPFSEAHFATFPPDLIEPCILAGTSERGCCPVCGAAWVRQVETPSWQDAPRRKFAKNPDLENQSSGSAYQAWRNANPSRTTGWSPSCSCPPHEPVPCTVLDPFFGAGTTGLVSDRLGRNCIGVELNPEYADMARNRVRRDAGLFAEVA